MEDELYHHGIKGQKWGVRRYQNPDGTWTTAGKERYGDDSSDNSKSSETGKSKSGTAKKVATGVAVTAAAVAGVALTAYLVKKYGNKDVASVADMASTGKDVFSDILESTSVASTPVSQIQVPKTEAAKTILDTATKAASSTVTAAKTAASKSETGSVVEKAVKTASSAATTAKSTISATTAKTPVHEIPNTYDFQTLMGQNEDLLKKMYSDLLS
jgi:uroporphyrinogen-III decarboxylase